MNRFIVVMLLLAIGICEVNAWTCAAEIELLPRATPRGSVVRLGDVARIATGDLAQTAGFEAIELFAAPPAGQKRYIRLREIQDALSARGVNLAQHNFTGVNLVSLEVPLPEAPRKAPTERKLTSADGSRLKRRVRDALLRYLREQGDRALGWDVSFDLTDEQARSLLAARGELTVTGGASPWTGDQQFTLSVEGAGEPVQIELDAQVTTPPAVVVATRSLTRGMRIGEADVRLLPAPALASETFQSLSDVIGREATQSIAADQPISPDQIRTPLLVRRGEVVTVYARSPGIRIRTTARVRDDGSEGELVTVEALTKDRKTYFARVCGLQEVEIYARAVSAVEAGAAPQDGRDERLTPASSRERN